MKKKLKSFLLGCLALIMAGTAQFSISQNNIAFADVTNGYEVYRSTDTATPVTTVSSLPNAVAYINANCASDDWIIKVTGDDPSVGSVSTLNAPGCKVTLTSSSGTNTLYQTTAGTRHINITAGNLVMENITLDGSGIGGGVVLGTGTTLTLNANGTIQNAKASQGGGIFCDGGGAVTLNSGSKVAGCQSTYAGTGGSGAGIYADGSVVLNEGSLVTGNTANGGKGGGLAICNAGSLVMNGGEISNNIVTGVSSDFQGGGVVIYKDATFKMYEGKITGNKADFGAGVSLWYTGAASTFTMYGGEISKNDTTFLSAVSGYHGYGGGVFAWGWGDYSIDIQGGKIIDNTARQGGGIMTYTTDSRIRVTGDAVMSGNQATWGGAIFNEGSESIISGNASIHDNAATSSGGGIYINKGLLSLHDEAIVTKNTAPYGAGVYGRSDFTMNDKSSIVENTSAYSGAGVYARMNFEMNDDAVIKGNAAGTQGGGVQLTSTAIFAMNGGTITANTAKTLGGGVSMSGPSPQFTMNAAGSPKLYGNIADVGADDFYSNGATTTATLISVGAMNLPAGVHATNWYYDEDAARYRDPATAKTIYSDSLLSGITNEVKLTIGIYYNVLFDSQGGSSVSDITGVTPNATISAPEDPTKSGYTFSGWYTDKDGTVAWDFANGKVTDDMTLYAKWTPHKHDVAFDSQGGSSVDGLTGVPYDTTFAKPTDPIYTGHTFDGWYEDKDCTKVWDFTTNKMPDNDITLYGKWIVDKYDITFDSKGGSSVGSLKDVPYDTSITNPGDSTYKGHTFGGWYKDEACTEVWDFDTDKVTGDMTLYAKWDINKYDVTFDSMGGTSVDKITDVVYDTTFTKPEDPTKLGNTFVGWYKDKDCTEVWNFDTDAISDNDMTLYAKWEVNKYNVTFDSKEGSAVDGLTGVEFEASVTKPGDPTKPGSTFGGWYKDEACTVMWDFATDTMPASDLTLYAKWTIDKYDATFNTQGGSKTDPEEGIEPGSTIPKPADPTKPGYTFGGWYKDKDCTEAWDFDTDTMPENGITLYAKWTKNETPVPTKEQEGDKDNTSQPQTGDTTDLTALWMAFAASLAGLSAMFMALGTRKKK